MLKYVKHVKQRPAIGHPVAHLRVHETCVVNSGPLYMERAGYIVHGHVRILHLSRYMDYVGLVCV